MITRFAPSPTGPLHLGHAYSAILAHDMAMTVGGTFLLRIEDIDRTRCRTEWEAQIYDDLRWLGLTWAEPVMRQSDRMTAYAQALDKLWEKGLLYPCTCTRRDIEGALAAPQEGVERPMGPDGPIYPGTCRTRMLHERNFSDFHPRPPNCAIRLEMVLVIVSSRAFQPRIERPDGGGNSYAGYAETGLPTGHRGGWVEFSANDLTEGIVDLVLARRDIGTSYHLSVVIDDAAQGITHVIRGDDLSQATKIHVVLQNLLGLPTPTYHHHRLIRDENGKRLAKRDDARAISLYRQEGATPEDIRRLVGL